jgi:glycerophosphoryl diester phosphodiesterase
MTIRPWIIGHRGAPGHAPENTMASFRRAVELGAAFIETDLRLSHDARFVAMHDATLDRTSNGRGMVRDFTLAQLRELDAGSWYAPEFVGEKIPTLEEILDFAREADVVFYLEIKHEAGWGVHHGVAAALRAANEPGRTVVISFDPSMLRNLRSLDAGVLMGLLFENPIANVVEKAQQIGVRQICPRADLFTPQLLREAQDAGLQVAAWTVNEPSRMDALISMGVNGIMTDYPDRLRDAVNRACAKK